MFNSYPKLKKPYLSLVLLLVKQLKNVSIKEYA